MVRAKDHNCRGQHNARYSSLPADDFGITEAVELKTENLTDLSELTDRSDEFNASQDAI